MSWRSGDAVVRRAALRVGLWLGLAAAVTLLVLITRNVWALSALFVVVVGFVGYRWYRRYSAQEQVIVALRNVRLPARMFLRDPDK